MKDVSFASKMWELDTNTPLKSDTMEDDVIEYVWCKMFYYMRNTEGRKKAEGGSNSEEEEADV